MDLHGLYISVCKELRATPIASVLRLILNLERNQHSHSSTSAYAISSSGVVALVIENELSGAISEKSLLAALIFAQDFLDVAGSAKTRRVDIRGCGLTSSTGHLRTLTKACLHQGSTGTPERKKERELVALLFLSCYF